MASQLLNVNLEEGGGGDTEGATVDGLHVALLSGGYRDVGLLEGGLDEVIAGVDAPTYGELGSLSAMSLQFPQNVVDARVHEQAVVDGHVLSSLAVDETEGAVLADGEAGVVAVAELVRRRDDRANGRV